MNVIGKRLKELRESMGHGPDSFAALLGIHRSSVYRYEGGNEAERRDIPINLAIEISQKCGGISLDWMAGLTDVKYINQSENELTKIYGSLSEKGQSELFSYALYLKNKEDGGNGKGIRVPKEQR